MEFESRYEITFADALTKQHWGTSDRRVPKPEIENAAALLAARNEVTGVQIQIRAENEYVLVTDRANWLHPLGFLPRLRIEAAAGELPEDMLELLPVGYVEGDDRRLWMETLDPRGYVEVPAGRMQAVYLRMRVPAGIRPAEYRVIVRAFAQRGFEDEQLVWEGVLRLNISTVQLPDPSEFRFHLNLWQHLTSIARFHRVGLWSNRHFELIDRYYASLAALGQKTVSLVVSEFPWSGQRCFRDKAYPSYLFEHSLVNVRRGADGALYCDFETLDRILELAKKHKIDRQIDLFGLVNIWQDEEYGFGKAAPDAPDAVRVRCYDENSGTFQYVRTADELRMYIRLLQNHFAKAGLIDRVRVAADEPADLDAFRQSLAFVHAAAPDFQFSAAINHFEFLEDAPPELLDFTPVLPLACKDPRLTAKLGQQLRERGGKLFWYVCCWPPLPNTFLHSPLVEGRLHGWLTHALGLDGFLRWAFCLWPAEPWKRVSWRAPDWSAGDMYYVLPGLDGTPVETLRYEALRMAAQDHELLCMVERELDPESARDVIARSRRWVFASDDLAAFAEVGTRKAQELYSLDPEDYHAARRVLLEALEAAG